MSDLRLETRKISWTGQRVDFPVGPLLPPPPLDGHRGFSSVDADRFGADIGFKIHRPESSIQSVAFPNTANWFGSFELDDGLRSAVWLSLFTNRRADPSDELPDDLRGGIPDLSGYWADFLSTLGEDDRMGSRLWLLRGQTLTRETRARARTYVIEALAWLETIGLGKAEVDIEVPRQEDQARRRGVLEIRITITDDVKRTSRRFEFVWDAMIREGV